MRKIIVYIIVLFCIFALIPPIEVSSDVAIRNVFVYPPIINKNSQIVFFLTLNEGLLISEKLYIKFPDGFLVPQIINNGQISIGDSGEHPLSVVVQENIIEISISRTIMRWEGGSNGIPVSFSSLSGIKNPATPYIYYFEIWTTREPFHTLAPIYIGEEIGGSSVSSVKVILTNYYASKNSGYDISFQVSITGGLSVNDFVDIYFPKGTIIPKEIKLSDIAINSLSPSKAVVKEENIRLYLPEILTIPPMWNCNIIFNENIGISNPEFTGNYAILVSTSKDHGIGVSNFYNVIGTQVTNQEIQLNPSTQLNPTEITLKFKTSNSGMMIKEQSKVNIKFPKGFTLSNNIKPGSIIVNGVPCLRVTISGDFLSFYSPINVDSKEDVVIIVKRDFGVVNPEKIDKYEFYFNTTSDAQLVSSSVTITPSTISDVSVTLSNSSAGQVSKYLINFRTGLSGRLDPGIDRINIVFPLGTTIPTLIPNSTVLINGTPTTLIEISGTTITVTPPLGINAGSAVSVEFTEEAGIRNPVTAQNYVVYVHTSKETTTIASSQYAIKNVPLTTVQLSPSQPDGLNGFYKTALSINFTVTSATDPNPTVYYFFDSNSPAVFSGIPIKSPEGIHTLFYYSIDREGHKEETKSIQIKVDTIPPVISVLSPKNNAVLSSSSVIVRGNVDPGSSVKINGESIQIDGMGNFEASIKLTNNPDVINIFAVDIAGNSSQINLNVSFDTNPPPLTITKPVMFQQVFKLPLIVEGKTEPGATVTVSGQAAIVNEDGSFSFAMPFLQENTLTNIDVIATDSAGNSTKRSVSIKYSKSIIMILQVNNNTALINNSTYTLEAAPVILSGRTMVPLRFVGEAFGAEFSYEATNKTIDIIFGNDKIKMQIGKKSATVNGKEVVLDVAPFIVNGRTLVPIRFISETFGAQVNWDGNTKTVTIVYPKT